MTTVNCPYCKFEFIPDTEEYKGARTGDYVKIKCVSCRLRFTANIRISVQFGDTRKAPCLNDPGGPHDWGTWWRFNIEDYTVRRQCLTCGTLENKEAEG